MLSPLATYSRANAWRARAGTAPRQVVEPTTPASYFKLTLYVFGFVFWIILGTLLAKYAPPAPKAAPEPTEEAPPAGWPHVGRWSAPY